MTLYHLFKIFLLEESNLEVTVMTNETEAVVNDLLEKESRTLWDKVEAPY